MHGRPPAGNETTNVPHSKIRVIREIRLPRETVLQLFHRGAKKTLTIPPTKAIRSQHEP